MTLFNSAEPLLRRKQAALDLQDRVGLWQIHWCVGTVPIVSRFYTRIDQIFVVWGILTAVIFGVAQFMPISWLLQAYVWSGLTIAGTVAMSILAWFWVTVERLRWVVYGWTALMLLGLGLTHWALVGGGWQLIAYFCPLWLLLCALGYLGTGWGLRSRTFLLTGLVHLAAIGLLPTAGRWQFLLTGIVLSGSLLLLSEVQWDMRPPIHFDRLTPEQQQFNAEQHRLRQASV